MICTISASLMASSIRHRVLASPLSHAVCAFISASVGSPSFADPGRLASSAMYCSSPRSIITASIRRFHGIQLWAFSSSIR
ncbi:hypothetical protein HYPSUDRAFT_143886 [Hypholoma sublateritium FD-334 SS-4]|uniref:Uncharacterized protein n=1 Tax=Hypholoma sublateritium (strain FD-334 SS-4) TaxID=945553 RepID=A0A0D2M7U0_HYPSF|nr:hypothetical protein HYPSUDRAFT_143886 [Hypholoma sublateritium FD-334 SS-4]